MLLAPSLAFASAVEIIKDLLHVKELTASVVWLQNIDISTERETNGRIVAELLPVRLIDYGAAVRDQADVPYLSEGAMAARHRNYRVIFIRWPEILRANSVRRGQ